MPKRRSDFIPPYRCHKPTNQAIVEFNGQRIYLGRFDSPSSHERYRKLIADWLANDRKLPRDAEEVSVAELCLGYWKWLEREYPPKDGVDSSTMFRSRTVIRDTRALFGLTDAADFKPRDLQLLQNTWCERGYTRKTVNEYTSIVKRMFRWGVASLDLPVEPHQRLCAVEGFRKGRTGAKESRKVETVPQAHIDAVQPYVSRQVWALIQLQLLTGARSGELVALSPLDLDTAGDIWTSTLASHKTAHHGKKRTLYFGPKAQAVIREFLNRPVHSPLFSPKEAEAERAARATTHRRPDQPPNSRKTSRTLGAHYTTDSYRAAVERGCAKADVPRWTPHRLRHNAATRIRSEHGLEAAQVILGHAHADVTQVYAETKESNARDLMRKMG